MEKRLQAYQEKMNEKGKCKTVSFEVVEHQETDTKGIAKRLSKYLDDLKIDHGNVIIHEDVNENVIGEDAEAMVISLIRKSGSKMYYAVDGKEYILEAVFYDIKEGITICLENYEEEMSLVLEASEVGKTIFFEKKELKKQ